MQYTIDDFCKSFLKLQSFVFHRPNCSDPFLFSYKFGRSTGRCALVPVGTEEWSMNFRGFFIDFSTTSEFCPPPPPPIPPWRDIGYCMRKLFLQAIFINLSLSPCRCRIAQKALPKLGSSIIPSCFKLGRHLEIDLIPISFSFFWKLCDGLWWKNCSI